MAAGDGSNIGRQDLIGLESSVTCTGLLLVEVACAVFA